MITILIQDPSPISRAGISFLLKGNPEFQIIKVVSTLDLLFKLEKKFRPQVVIMDYKSLVEIKNGFINCKEICMKNTAILLLNISEYENLINEFLELGIVGVLERNISQDHLFEAIEKVSRGEILFSITQMLEANKKKKQY